MNIIYIVSKRVLHIVDIATKLSPARFLPDSITISVWTLFVECCAGVHTDLLNNIRVDRGSCFGDDFYTISNSTMSDIAWSGIDTHSSHGIGERLDQLLRNTFRKETFLYREVFQTVRYYLCVPK